MVHLWMPHAAPCPPEYLDLFLCRDVYHCAPDTLDHQDPIRVLTHLTCISTEVEVRKMQRQLG